MFKQSHRINMRESEQRNTNIDFHEFIFQFSKKYQRMQNLFEY